MLAADTNIVVRLLIQDDPQQTARAEALFRSEEVWLAKTVLLETEWVLRSTYHYPDERAVTVLRKLVAMPNVQVEDPAAVARALDWASAGLEFADALHVASRAEHADFVSFDQTLVKRAKRAGVSSVLAL